MGDVLAAIREKSQALQEESKAKRFRDRGGLWQPLSPSKNKLMAFLNSAEFQSITEEPPCAEQKAESSRGPEVARRPKVGNKVIRPTPRSKKKGKAISSDIDDRPRKHVVSARPKTKGKGKAPSTAESTEREKSIHSGSKLRDPLFPTHPKIPSTLPNAENPIVAAKKTSGVNSRQKRKAAVVADEEDGPTTATEMTKLKQAQPQSATRHIDEHVTPPRRSKRASNKRGLQEMLDEEVVLSDYRPSPPKKSRTRAAPDAFKEPMKVENVKRSGTKNKHSMENKALIPKAISIPDSSPIDIPIEVDTSCSRKHTLEPSDADEPVTVKSRRTRNVWQTKETPESTRRLHIDYSDVDMTSDNEVSKPRKRRTLAPKASTKSSSRAKHRRNPHEKSPVDSNDDTVQSESRNKPGIRGGLQLSTIQEEEEIKHGSRVVSKEPIKRSASIPQLPGSEHVKQTLGMTKRKRKKVRVEPDGSDITVRLDQEVGQALGTSKKNSARHVASPPHLLDPHLIPLNKNDLLVSKAQTSKTHSNSSSKPKNKFRRSVNISHEDMGVVPPVKTSKRRKAGPKDNEFNELNESKMMQELNKPFSSHKRDLEPTMDSDFDEIDFLT